MSDGWNELMKRQGRDDARVGLASMADRLSRPEERVVYQAAYDRERERLRAEAPRYVRVAEDVVDQLTRPDPKPGAELAERVAEHAKELDALGDWKEQTSALLRAQTKALQAAQEHITGLQADAMASAQLYAKLRASRGRQVEALEKEVAKLRAATKTPPGFGIAAPDLRQPPPESPTAEEIGLAARAARAANPLSAATPEERAAYAPKKEQPPGTLASARDLIAEADDILAGRCVYTEKTAEEMVEEARGILTKLVEDGA